MAILRTHDDFIWLDVTERCTNDEKTTTEIWLAHELYAISDQSDSLLETYDEVKQAIDNGCLIGIEVGFLSEAETRGEESEAQELRLATCLPYNDKHIIEKDKPLKLTVKMTEPEVDLTSFSWDDFTNLNK